MPTCSTVNVLPVSTLTIKVEMILSVTEFAIVAVIVSPVPIWVVILAPHIETVAPSSATPPVVVYSFIFLHKLLWLSATEVCCVDSPFAVT